MARRAFLWVTVASFVGLAVTGAASAAAMFYIGDGAFTFYTPFPAQAPTLAERVIEVTNYAQFVLYPVAALSLAAYLLLLDRDVNRVAASRGFDVEPRR